MANDPPMTLCDAWMNDYEAGRAQEECANRTAELRTEIDTLRTELAEARRERARTTLTSFVEGLDEGRYHLLDLPADLLERMRQAFLPEHSEHRSKTDD